MTRQVVVTSAQKKAAQVMVRRAAATGREVPTSVLKIANARLVTPRPMKVSAKT